MSIRPFSTNEIANLRMVLEKNGWQIYASLENNFRYSLKKDKLIVFTIKFPVAFPLRINVPLEIVNFRLSLVFKIWDLNQTTNKLILYILKIQTYHSGSGYLDISVSMNQRQYVIIMGPEEEIKRISFL